MKYAWIGLVVGCALGGGLLLDEVVGSGRAGFTDGELRKTSVVVSSAQQKLVDAAHWQVAKTLYYDPSYVSLSYPNGDVPLEKGVCTDVVIRALRRGAEMDLQQRVHEDMTRHFSKYPKIWGLSRPDKNIDHRRVPNLRVYFERQGWSLAVTRKAEDYLPGDIVTCTVAGNRPHIMLVSDYTSSSGEPLVIHNIGAGVQMEAVLFTYPLTGHYRVK